MKVNIEMLQALLKERNDKGISAKFLQEVPKIIKSFFKGEIPIKKCAWERVPQHRDMFKDIKANGVKKPLTFYWDRCGFEIDGYHRLACAIALEYKTIEAIFHPNIEILVVMAHPDDEIIFGWPVMQDLSIKKSLLVCASDFYNPKRTFVKNRKYVLEEACKRLNITDYYCFDYSSEFYRLETRKESLKVMLNKIANYMKDRLKGSGPVVFTHNVFGEYGNIDHRLVNFVCMGSVPHVMYTDITQESNWMPFQDAVGIPKRVFYKHPFMECTLDMDFYNEFKALYQEKKCWTWDKPPIENCKVYLE